MTDFWSIIKFSAQKWIETHINTRVASTYWYCSSQIQLNFVASIYVDSICTLFLSLYFMHTHKHFYPIVQIDTEPTEMSEQSLRLRWTIHNSFWINVIQNCCHFWMESLWWSPHHNYLCNIFSEAVSGNVHNTYKHSVL